MTGAALVALAMVLSPPPGSTDAVAPALVAFDAACLEVRGDREAFENVAKAQGWTSVNANVRDRDWVVAYRSGELIIRLSQYRAETVEDGVVPARICAVDRIEAGPEWEQKLSMLVVDGAPLGNPSQPDMSTYQMPPDMELAVWDLADGSRIHASYVPARSYLELSINYPTGR